MITDLQQMTLDYASLDADTRVFVEELDAELDLVLKRTAEELGHIFLKAKKGLPHGLYMPWIASKGISETTAWRCMQIAQGKELKSFKMKDLDVEVVEQLVEPVEEKEEPRNLRVTNRNKQDVLESFFEAASREELGKLSNIEIADRTGVTEGTVRNHKKKLKERQEEAQCETYEESHTERASLVDIFDPVGHSIPTVYLPPGFGLVDGKPFDMPLPDGKPVEIPEEWKLPLDMRTRNIDNIPLAVPHISSKNNEWYTPSKYIEAARELMGGIDLDPASCEQANEAVKAAEYYHISKSGLEHDWHGRVWLNPPYGYTDGRSNQDLWSDRLIGQFDAGNTKEAVLLVNAAVDTKWFQRLFAFPVCFPDHRINFSTPEPSSSGSTHGSALVYIAPKERWELFRQLFRQFGAVKRGGW